MLDFLKGALQSKTMWFNGGLTILGLIGWITDHSSVILALAPQMAPVLTIIGAVGMVLRVLTESTPQWNPAVAAPPAVVQPQPETTVILPPPAGS